MRTILVTYDDDRLLRLASRNLELHWPRINMVAASSGPEAWDLYQHARPDLVITNLMKAGFSGYELIRRIREGDPSTKILVTTASSGLASRNQALALGADLFMGAPFGARDLFRAVYTLLPDLTAGA